MSTARETPKSLEYNECAHQRSLSFIFVSICSRYSGSSSRYSNSSSSYKFSEIREETESDYMYQENRKSSGYSKYANDGLSNGLGSMSLNGLREAKIDSWDSMGILG